MMQPLYWLCEPPHNKGGLIWTVRLHDHAASGVAKSGDVANSKFIPEISKLKSRVLPKIKQACGSLFFTTSLEKAKGNVIDNGSFAFVHTGKKFLLVTCHHVWNGFLAAREKNADLKLCACFDDRYPVAICSTSEGTPTEPIAQDKDLDIAVFDMEPFLSFCSGDKNFFIPNYGPQSQVNVNDLVAIIGHPGNERFDSEIGLFFGRKPYCAYVSGISGYKIRVDFTRVMSLDRELTAKQSDEKPATAGVSGSPCFVVRQDYEPYLIGFVTDHVRYELSEHNYLQMTSATCINEDGTLKPTSSFYGNPSRGIRV